MKIKAFTGPMMAGKTHYLRCIIDEALNNDKAKGVYIFDLVNSRNSDRDLNSLFPELLVTDLEFMKKKIQESEKIELLVIDEVHLYQVLKKSQEFFEIFYLAKEKGWKIILGGIVLDGYNKGKCFKIWLDLFPYIDVIYNLPSRTPCHYCNTPTNVFFSVPANFASSGTEKIGDNYFNVCKSCFDRIFTI